MPENINKHLQRISTNFVESNSELRIQFKTGNFALAKEKSRMRSIGNFSGTKTGVTQRFAARTRGGKRAEFRTLR